MTRALPIVLVLAAATGGAEPLRVRANAAFEPCLRPALDAFTRRTGVAVAIDVGEPDPPAEAALVVGDDAEMRRLLEGGRAEVRTAVDLGTLPWVTVVPTGTDVRGLAAASEPVVVMGGAAGRLARASLSGTRAARLDVTRDAQAMRRAAYALVPRSLAGVGEHRASTVTPLVATAAVVLGASREADARRLLAFLQTPPARAILATRLDPMPAASSAAPQSAPYAVAIADWWLPQCSLQRNGYNDPNQVVGGPDAVNLGGKDNYRGIMSLGQGGWVVIDMGATVVNGPGDDIRVYQATSNEEVTVYASANPQGPFVLIGLREPCGTRGGGFFSGHCDFDLAAGGLAEARYLKIEDGEIYPCLSGDTLTEGADIDSVQALNFR